MKPRYRIAFSRPLEIDEKEYVNKVGFFIYKSLFGRIFIFNEHGCFLCSPYKYVDTTE